MPRRRCAFPPSSARAIACTIAALALPACEGVRGFAARVAGGLAEQLEPEDRAPTSAPSDTTPRAAWSTSSTRDRTHTLEVHAAPGTRVFFGPHEETVAANGSCELAIAETDLVEPGALALVAADGSRSQLALPELAGPRLAEVVRLDDCSASDEALVASGPVIGTEPCALRNPQLQLAVPSGAQVRLGARTRTAEHDKATFPLELGELALAQGMRVADPTTVRSTADGAADLTLALQVRWRGQTLDTTIELRLAEEAMAIALRETVSAFEARTLALPGTTEAADTSRSLVAMVDGRARLIGAAGPVGDIDLVAMHEVLPPRNDGRCGPYGQFGWGHDYVPRKALDERWTVYDARTRAVVAARTFKAKRPTCPYSIRLDDDTTVQGSPDAVVIVQWLEGFARPS